MTTVTLFGKPFVHTLPPYKEWVNPLVEKRITTEKELEELTIKVIDLADYYGLDHSYEESDRSLSRYINIYVGGCTIRTRISDHSISHNNSQYYLYTGGDNSKEFLLLRWCIYQLKNLK